MESNVPPPSLLLLPAPASWKRSSLRTACHPTLSNVLPFVAKSVHGTDHIARLDVAVVLPESVDIRSTPRVTLFAQTQTLLKQLYTLLCIIATEKKVELDFPGGVDVRIFMLEAMREGTPVSDAYSGPLVNLATLVSARRAYDPVFSVESEQGEDVLQAFLSLHTVLPNPSPPNVRRVIGGTSMSTPSSRLGTHSPATATDPSHSPRAHYSVAVGGTFDHLHIGHKLLLTATALTLSPSPSQSARDRFVTIGITGDELLVNKKFASEVESWDLRQTRTADFFESIFAFPTAHAALSSRMRETISRPTANGHLVRITYLSSNSTTTTINYTRIADPYGPTITDANISALVISAETRAGGKAVNDNRTEKGWTALEIFEVDVLDASPPGNNRTDDDEDEDDDTDSGPLTTKDTSTTATTTTTTTTSTFESKISSTEIRRRLAEAKGGAK